MSGLRDLWERMVCALLAHQVYAVPHSAGCYRIDHRDLPDEVWCRRCGRWIGATP